MPSSLCRCSYMNTRHRSPVDHGRQFRAHFPPPPCRLGACSTWLWLEVLFKTETKTALDWSRPHKTCQEERLVYGKVLKIKEAEQIHITGEGSSRICFRENDMQGVWRHGWEWKQKSSGCCKLQRKVIKCSLGAKINHWNIWSCVWSWGGSRGM